MTNVRISLAKEAFEAVQQGRWRRCFHAQSKRLCRGRLRPVVHREDAVSFKPAGSRLREHASPRFHESNVCKSFGTFQTPRQRKIRKEARNRYFFCC